MSQSSVVFVPLSQSLAPAPKFTQPCPPQADLPPHLAQVRKKTRFLVPITSDAVVTSSYGVSNSNRDSSNREPTALQAENCCIVAFRGPQPQVSRNSRDELIVKKISARDSSNALVAPLTTENEIAYSTHGFCFTSFEMCAVKQSGVRRTAARVLDALAAKPLSLHDSCAKLLTNDVICTRDSATSRAAPRTKSHSALDLTPKRLVSCAHRNFLEGLLEKDCAIRHACNSKRCAGI